MQGLSIQRLRLSDKQLAGETFFTMAQIFDEDHAKLSETYLETLLGRSDFYALAAIHKQEVLGGLTAFILPLTRLEHREFLIYDIAVKPEWQRKGIGRLLVESLRQAAAAEGIADGFVLADNEDIHALDFYRALGASPSPVTAFSFAATLPKTPAHQPQLPQPPR